jgi:hypothetical protein
MQRWSHRPEWRLGEAQGRDMSEQRKDIDRLVSERHRVAQERGAAALLAVVGCDTRALGLRWPDVV